MPAPTPTSPTLADLQYGSYDGAGNLRVATGEPLSALSIAAFDPLATRESLVPQFVGYTGSVDTSDFLGTAENVQLSLDAPGPNGFSIVTSDATTTAEAADPSKQPGGVRVASVSDSIATSESVSVAEA